MGNCRYCGQNAGFLRRSHRDCDDAYKTGRERMVALVAEAAGQPDFNESSLLDNLSILAGQSFVDHDGTRAVIAEGWRQAVREGLADGILTRDEEARLREFREQFAIETDDKAGQDTPEQLDRAARARLMTHARLAAGGDGHVASLATALADSSVKRLDRCASEFPGLHNNRPADTPAQMTAMARCMDGRRLRDADLFA